MAGAMKWTWEENKAFELALVEVPDSPAKLEIIAAQMRKPVEEIRYHYGKLVQDVAIIESGGVVVPEYSPRSASLIVPKKWTWEENKAFEVALVEVHQDSPAKLEIIAAQMRRPVEEIKYHYDKLVQDVAIIESGGVVVPEYSPRSATPILPKKGTRWSAQEHERFLEGLKAKGPGDWKAISRDFVKTRGQNQVKWHGQYYLKKQKVEAETKEGKGSESGDLKKTD